MGSYLSQPNTEKNSENSESNFLKVGSSAMQGWRINQEDAHNVILDFDEKTAFMAVYDGHGGSEVAEYCSLKLAKFLKQTEAYKNGNLEEALRQAFLGFDSTLLEKDVVEELKVLAKNNPDYAEDDEIEMETEEDVHDDIHDLRKEADMPLCKVLEKYKKEDGLPQSPALKGKGNVAGGSGSGSSGASSSSMAGSSGSGSSKVITSSRRDHSDATVSSSSSKPVEEVADVPSSSDVVVPGNGETPDSSSTPQPDKTNEVDQEPTASEASSSNPSQQNGESTVTKSDEAIISSSAVENGASSPSVAAKTISSSSPVVKPVVKPLQLEETDSEESTDDEYDQAQQESDSEELQESQESESEDPDEEGEDEDEEGLTDEDEKFMNNMVDEPGKDSGCTAVVALLQGNELYVANAGDSRCIVSRGGKAVPMSFDHKPEDEPEFERIRKAGGRVSTDGRVNGGLNLSRAIGDHGYKTNEDLPAEEQMISALPDIKTLTLTEEDEFMVLACDGIWNFMTNDEVRDFVKERLDAGETVLSEICEELFEKCLAPDTQGDGTGCDNMTAMIVLFKPSIVQQARANPKKRSIDLTEINEVENLDTKRQKIAEADDEAPATVTST